MIGTGVPTKRMAYLKWVKLFHSLMAKISMKTHPHKALIVQ